MLLGTAAQNEDVTRGALGSLDKTNSLRVAAPRYLTDHQESASRALCAGCLEETARLPEVITAPRFSISSISTAPYSERDLQGPNSVP